MPNRPSTRDIAEQDGNQLQRQQIFRAAADVVAARFIARAEVQRVALFGSVARPLEREVPRFQPFRRLGIEVLHECKDVDLAVWLTDLRGLRELGRDRNVAVSQVSGESGGVAHHQVDVFLLDFVTGAYVGRLCTFASCPKGKHECLVPRCGETPFLRKHLDFVFAPDALDNSVTLFDRSSGARELASDLPRQSP